MQAFTRGSTCEVCSACRSQRPSCELIAAGGQGTGEDGVQYEAECRPVYLALIDATGGPVFMELVKGAVLAALEAMPACYLFGLATFSSEVIHAHVGQHPASSVWMFSL